MSPGYSADAFSLSTGPPSTPPKSSRGFPQAVAGIFAQAWQRETPAIQSRAAGDGHSFRATSGPVIRVSSGNVAAMMPREMTIPAAVSR